MSEHPIIFSGPMVRAILAGTKTQTRRVISSEHAQDADVWREGVCGRCPFGSPGDRLWVRETWQTIHVFVDPETGCGDGLEYSTTVPVSDRDGWWTPVYAATDPQASDHRDDRGFPWRPAIHMPRWASRITLEVTGVRVERLQEITEEDAQSEGIATEVLRYWQGLVRLPGGGRGLVEGGADPDGPPPANFEHPEVQTISKPARETFRLGWDTINGKRASWASNPWVWVVSFRRVQP